MSTQNPDPFGYIIVEMLVKIVTSNNFANHHVTKYTKEDTKTHMELEMRILKSTIITKRATITNENNVEIKFSTSRQLKRQKLSNFHKGNISERNFFVYLPHNWFNIAFDPKNMSKHRTISFNSIEIKLFCFKHHMH